MLGVGHCLVEASLCPNYICRASFFSTLCSCHLFIVACMLIHSTKHNLMNYLIDHYDPTICAFSYISDIE